MTQPESPCDRKGTPVSYRNGAMQKYADLFARSRTLVAAFVAAVSVIAFVGLSRIEFDDIPRNIFASDDAAFAQVLELFDDFGSDDNELLILAESDDWFAADAVEALRTIATEAREIVGVDEVVWFGDVLVFDNSVMPRPLLPVGTTDETALGRARELASEHALIRGQLLSEDGKVALVFVRLRDELVGISEIEPAVASIRSLAQRWNAELRGSDGAKRVHVTGIPPIRVDVYHTIQFDQIRFPLIGGAFCILLSLFLFRSVGAVMCTSIPPVIGAMWAFGFIGLTGSKLDLLSGILSMLVIVIGLTDAIHLVIDVRQSRASGMSALDSAVDAIRHLGVPCALTSLTTAVGFGSLSLADVPAIRHFGLLAAGAVAMGFLAVITLTPLMAALVSDVGTSRASGEGKGASPWTRCAAPVARFVTSHPLVVSIVGVVSTLCLLALSLGLTPENRLTEALPREEAYEGLMLAEEAFGGVLPNYALVEWDDSVEFGSAAWFATIDAIEALFEGVGHGSPPLSIATIIDAVPGGRARAPLVVAALPPQVARRFVRPDLQRALVVVRVADLGSDETNPVFERLRDGLEEIERAHTGFDLALTGTDVVARTNINRMIDDLVRSLVFAALIIFAVIALEFRSLRVGAMSLLPNLFPLVLVGGALRLAGQPLLMAHAVLFTVLLGLAVDDTIHFLSRLRRVERGAKVPRSREVVVTAYLAVGRAILITTLILFVGFLTIALSSVPTNKYFALTACLGLIGALLGDLVFLPALACLRRPK